jgi:ABC-2 type transport system ATP-binding protein
MATTPQAVEDHAGRGSAQHDGHEIIRTVDLTKVYAGTDFAAVDRLDLSIEAGEVFGLLGPNGAGKTTTAGMLTTRVVPTSGSAFVGAIDVVAHPTLAKQLIGIVSQQNTLDRQLTVRENLYFHGRLFGIPARESGQIADRLLEQFQLSRWAKASVYALSGGMAQRLMVARAIFHRPAVLFLDEPTAGLDPQSRLALWEILGELNRDGQTIMLTTHYMEEADQLCGRVAIMDHGRILALDTPAALKQSVGVDTIVTLKARGDSALGRRLERGAAVGAAHARARRRRRAARRGPSAWCRAWSTRPRAPASRSLTCRWPSRASRPSSSTSQARSCANDGRLECNQRAAGLAPNPCNARAQRRWPPAASRCGR